MPLLPRPGIPLRQLRVAGSLAEHGLGHLKKCCLGGVLFLLAASPLAAQGSLEYFGYAISDSTLLSDISFYTNVAVYRPSSPTSNVAAVVGSMAAQQVRPMIDLDDVLWCDNPPTRHLCSDYVARLSIFAVTNRAALTSASLLAFYVVDEPLQNGIPVASVNLAIQAVNAQFPGVPTSYTEAYTQIGLAGASYPLSPFVDWFGIDKYFMRDPAADPCTDDASSCTFPGGHAGYSFAAEVAIAQQLMTPRQRFIYVMDGWFDACHQSVNPACPYEGSLHEEDMDAIAAAWYAMASRDPKAILLAVFTWNSSPGLVGSVDLPSSVKARHQSIGRSITGKRGPAGACQENPVSLCLASGRFQVSADWESAGAQGHATAVPLTGDTGYFWFFSPSNVEVVVKVLDACSLNGKFWVFASGLTNVFVTITVTDTATGTVRTFDSPQNTPFPPIQDTSAFSCP
jgi:hypothetical protein